MICLKNRGVRGIKAMIAKLPVLAVCVVASSFFTAAATPLPDLEFPCSVKLDLPDTIQGTVELYRVADSRFRGEEILWQFTDDFASCGISAEAIDYKKDAELLFQYAKSHSVKAQASKPAATEESAFSDLSAGLYLIGHAEKQEGEQGFLPFLIPLPFYSQTDGMYLYTVTAAPKIGLPVSPPPPPVTPPDRLPQTGQLIWPIPVFAVIGVLCLFIALASIKRTRAVTIISLLVIGILALLFSAGLTSYNIRESNEAGEQAQSVQEELTAVIQNHSAEKGDLSSMTIQGKEVIGLLAIPSEQLELPIIGKYEEKDLKVSPCRYAGSLETKDLVIAGHNYQTHFGVLRNLTPGDQVLFTTVKGDCYCFTVSTIEILSPRQTKEMLTADEWDLTLFTCTASGRDRVAVRCVEGAVLLS